MQIIWAVFGAAIFLASCMAKAESAEPVTAEGPILAELFTSQGCSSCPPAEAYFETLTDHDHIAVIVWHVDIWDTLVHGGSSWKDPYSQAAFTTRLREYNKVLRGTPQIYTPQAIIGGERSVIGSRKLEVQEAIETAKPPVFSVAIEDGVAKITGPETARADIIFVRLLREHTTQIEGGENKGRQLSGKNIALQGLVLGKWSGDTESYRIPELSPKETCAVIVQAPRAGRVLGTGICG